MESIHIAQTSTSPQIDFDIDRNTFKIEGCSRPEDVASFYDPILLWILNLKQSINSELIGKYANNPLAFCMCYDYFNSSSAKYILDMVLIIDELFKKGLNVKIVWQYKSDDDDMREVGEEFTELLKCPFEFESV